MNIPKYIEQYRNDLLFKNYSHNTIDNYVSQVDLFLRFYNGRETEPSKINESQIKEWLMLAKTTNSMKHRLSALKLFYKYTIKQPMKFKYVEYPRSWAQKHSHNSPLRKSNRFNHPKYNTLRNLAE